MGNGRYLVNSFYHLDLQAIAMPRTDQKAQTRQKILDAAAREFRVYGFHGIGVDGLARSAGLTSGAFYRHYASKAEAFVATLTDGFDSLRQGVEDYQRAAAPNWWAAFVDFYLREKRTCALSEGCILPSLAGELPHSDVASREAFRLGLQRVIGQLLAGPAAPDAPRDEAAALWALTSLAGCVSMARALDDPAQGELLAARCRAQLLPSQSSAAGRG